MTDKTKAELDICKLMERMVGNGLTPADVAEEIEVTPRTMGAWLIGEGQPRRSSLKAMSLVLGFRKPEDLLVQE